MRRAVLCLAAVAACLAAAGCGSSNHAKVAGPVAAELSYFAPGAPLVAAVQTASTGTAIQNAEGLLGDFPVGRLAITALESDLPASLNYQADVEPLFGNPITVGVLARTSFVAVWVTRSAAKLDTVIKAFPQLHASGSYDGATLYATGGSATVAVDGATVLFASSKAGAQAALSRHAHGGGLSPTDLSKAMAGLPAHPLLEAFGSLSGLLSSSKAAVARQIPWVAASRDYGAALTASSAGLSLEFRLDTSGGSLTSAELPVAAGTAAPSVAGTLPITLGLRDPAQSLGFFERAAQATSPGGYAQFTRKENAAKGKTGYDLSTFAALLTGDLTIASNTKTTMARAQVSDPASAKRQLAKLPSVVRDIFGNASGITRARDGFYAIRQRHGKTIELGLVGNEFVAGLATPAQLKAFAAAPATAVPGAQGALAVRISVLELIHLALGRAPSQLIQSVLSTLGDVTGSASATTGALTGHLTLGVK